MTGHDREIYDHLIRIKSIRLLSSWCIAKSSNTIKGCTNAQGFSQCRVREGPMSTILPLNIKRGCFCNLNLVSLVAREQPYHFTKLHPQRVPVWSSKKKNCSLSWFINIVDCNSCWFHLYIRLVIGHRGRNKVCKSKRNVNKIQLYGAKCLTSLLHIHHHWQERQAVLQFSCSSTSIYFDHKMPTKTEIFLNKNITSSKCSVKIKPRFTFYH